MAIFSSPGKRLSSFALTSFLIVLTVCDGEFLTESESKLLQDDPALIEGKN